MDRKVVITGLGAVCGFGYGAESLWNGLLEGRTSIRRIRGFDPGGFRAQLGAEATEFSVRDHVPKSYRKAVKVMARDIEFAVGAAKSAVEHGGLVTGFGQDSDTTPTYPSNRIACHIGAGLIASDVTELSRAFDTARDEAGEFSYAAWGEQGMNNLTPLWLLKYLPNMLSCHVTILHDARGPSNTLTCGEASGLLSIGESLRVIQRDAADIGFAGGAESKINPMGLMRMDLLDRLARVQLDPDQEIDWAGVVRPYDTDAPGSVLGEGGGIVLLEEAESARKRGAQAIAIVAGFGAGHSPASDDPATRAKGLTNAIRAALADADIQPSEIDAIVPHGSGNLKVDAEELAAFQSVFADHLAEVEFITLTPAIGDLMAGQGGLATCVAALALQHKTLPARLHGGSTSSGLRVGPASQRDAQLRHILVCTNAMGGQNAALILRSP